MLSVGQSRFTRTRQAKKRCDVMLLDIFSLEHFQATMTRNVSISCSRSPRQGQSCFFQFSKVVQSQNRHTIVIGIKISQTIWIVRMRPFRVKKDKNIIFVIPFGNLQTVFKFLIQDRKSTRLNSSHVSISYAVSCLKKKKT